MSNLCDYSDVYILVKETITVPNMGAAERNDRNKEVMFKDYKRYFLSTVEIKGYNLQFMINGKSFFDRPVKII